MQTLNEIYIYPIKSAGPICLPFSSVEEKGLAFDRRYMLTDENGKFITGRTYPQLTQISVKLIPDGLIINAPSMQTLTISESEFSKQRIKSKVWSDEVDAQHCHDEYDLWFSLFLEKKCQLVYCADSTTRLVKRKTTQVSFADGYPLLLVNQRSLDQLNTRLETPVTALHFRPNIVVNGNFPFVEDSWQLIKIGEVEFEVSKPCGRCPFIHVNPKTGQVLDKLTLETLAKFRFFEGSIDFGQNLIALNSGVIKEGDEVQVLATKRSPYYGGIDDIKVQNKKTVKIKDLNSDVTFEGNNHQLMSDQLEKAGINLPYSCRKGICGYCKVKLTTGSVITLNDEALSETQKANGYVLPCSCIPASNLTIG